LRADGDGRPEVRGGRRYRLLLPELGRVEEPPICAGYLLLAKAIEGVKAHWPFSDEADNPSPSTAKKDET